MGMGYSEKDIATMQPADIAKILTDTDNRRIQACNDINPIRAERDRLHRALKRVYEYERGLSGDTSPDDVWGHVRLEIERSAARAPN